MNRHDLVHRDDIISAIEKNMPHAIFDDCGHYTMRGMRLLDVISAVPVAQPEYKKGKWIDYTDEGYVECPFCHSATNCDGNKDELHFCFSCGADMRGERDG